MVSSINQIVESASAAAGFAIVACAPLHPLAEREQFFRRWLDDGNVVDASGKTLGRLSTEIARRLRPELELRFGRARPVLDEVLKKLSDVLPRRRADETPARARPFQNAVNRGPGDPGDFGDSGPGHSSVMRCPDNVVAAGVCEDTNEQRAFGPQTPREVA